MRRYTYPHTIDNGAGERLTFLRRVPGVAGDRLEVENVVAPGDATFSPSTRSPVGPGTRRRKVSRSPAPLSMVCG